MHKLRLGSVFLLSLSFALIATIANANVFGTVRGVVHDPQHRPIQNAAVKLKAKASDWSQSGATRRKWRIPVQCRAARRLHGHGIREGICRRD